MSTSRISSRNYPRRTAEGGKTNGTAEKAKNVIAHLLWDASEIWGLLAEWSLRSMGLPLRIVRAAEIADGRLAAEKPALLLVPGGFARQKARALGPAGLAAIRAYVASGGQYLGFCGGAGLALSGDGGLALCPWGRAGYADRSQHFMSGHVFVDATPHELTPPDLPARPLLPVWWPGRFAPAGNDVTVLAAYQEPGPDFQLGDASAAFASEGDPAFAFMRGAPCLIHGAYGRGGYTLSYSHLETPDSPQANVWLAHLLRRLSGLSPERERVAAWNVAALPLAWNDPDLLFLRDAVTDIFRAGEGRGLFFARTPWLTGWQAGLPGAGLNTLRARIHTLLARPPAPKAKALWRKERGAFLTRFRAAPGLVESDPAAWRESLPGLLALPDELACLQLQDSSP